MSGITTHVLDTSLGRPAPGVSIRLELKDDSGQWSPVGQGRTDADGRQRTLMADRVLKPGTYRLTFDVGNYFRSHDRASFFPQVSIEFEIADASQHYHVPLLLSPYGYSTYRGS